MHQPVKLTITSALYTSGPIYEIDLPDPKKANNAKQPYPWDGKANCAAGDLKDLFIHPLLSPYKITLYHSDQLKSEKEFKVLYHSVKLQRGPWTPDEQALRVLWYAAGRPLTTRHETSLGITTASTIAARATFITAASFDPFYSVWIVELSPSDVRAGAVDQFRDHDRQSRHHPRFGDRSRHRGFAAGPHHHPCLDVQPVPCCW